ncbi:MAG TPA: glycosyltransferase, partial [Oscillatoriaceae cyanobacterium]
HEHDLSARPRDLASQAQALLTGIVEQSPELTRELAPNREAELRDRLSAQPRQAGLWLELAFVLFQKARAEDALEALARCIELDAGLAPAFHLLGMLLDQSGQPGYAERAFAASLALEPNNQMALSCLEVCRGKPVAEALSPEQSARIERLLACVHPTLSACLIVRNEAEKLARCLKSLEGRVDEIVVVDTGSTDETVAIAESFGAKVHHYQWCDDFAAARNVALEHATGDWILAIDADEELIVEDAAAFRRALRDRTCGGYVFTVRNLTDLGTISNSAALRLFQRHERVRFAGRLHEKVTDALLALGWPVGSLEAIAFAHDGYVEAGMAAQNKRARNRRIAAAAVEADPRDPYRWYNLARASLPDADEALAALTPIEKLLEDGGELSESVYPHYAVFHQGLLCALGRAAEAEALLDRAVERYPGHPELHYERGALRARRGDVAAARRDFLACLTPNAYVGAERRDGITGELPRRALAELERRLSEKPLA